MVATSEADAGASGARLAAPSFSNSSKDMISTGKIR
jgi:hypothetical protein